MKLSPAEKSMARLIVAGVPFDGAADTELDVPLPSETEWRSIATCAQDARLAPLLFAAVRARGCEQALPADVWDSLKTTYLQTHVTTLWVYRDLSRLLKWFCAEHIPVVVLKGAALAKVLYADLGLRPMCDLDVMVPRLMIPRAVELLAADGYRPTLEPEGFQQSFRTVVEFEGAQRARPPLEVHWHLFHIPYYRERIPVEWFWQRTTEIRFDDQSALVLSPEAQWLYLSTHLVLRHQANGLLWLYDLALLMSRYHEVMAWNIVVDAAQQFGLRQVVRTALADVESAWGVSVPDAARALVEQLRPSIGERLLVVVNTSRHVDAQEPWHALNLPGFQKLGYLRQTLFPDRAYMQTRYHIADARWMPLHYVLRLGKGLVLVVRSAISILRRMVLGSE
jgi:hypothetical protein